jgi:hypothetical protein
LVEAKITVKETTGKKFYAHALSELEIAKPNASGETTNQGSLGYHQPSGSEITLPQEPENVEQESLPSCFAEDAYRV